jgi:hypothetical protein
MDIIKTEPESHDVSSPTSQLNNVHDVQCQDPAAALCSVVKSEEEVSFFHKLHDFRNGRRKFLAYFSPSQLEYHHPA